MQYHLIHKGGVSLVSRNQICLPAFASAGVAVQVEDDAAASTSQQQAQLMQESHTSIAAALEQVVMHGELLTARLLALHRLL